MKTKKSHKIIDEDNIQIDINTVVYPDEEIIISVTYFIGEDLHTVIYDIEKDTFTTVE